MRTSYGKNTATTHFDTAAEYYKFIRENSNSLVLIDADLQHKLIRWKFR